MPSLGSVTSEDVAAGAAVVVVAFAGSVVVVAFAGSVVLGRPSLVVVERSGGADDAVGDEAGRWGTVDVVVCVMPHDVATSTMPTASAQRRSRKDCA
jgi:hypothetical protein